MGPVRDSGPGPQPLDQFAFGFAAGFTAGLFLAAVFPAVVRSAAVPFVAVAFLRGFLASRASGTGPRPAAWSAKAAAALSGSPDRSRPTKPAVFVGHRAPVALEERVGDGPQGAQARLDDLPHPGQERIARVLADQGVELYVGVAETADVVRGDRFVHPLDQCVELGELFLGDVLGGEPGGQALQRLADLTCVLRVL